MAIWGILFDDGAGRSQFDATNLVWDDTDKRVGIGTNTPSRTLDVDGDVKISGNLEVKSATTYVKELQLFNSGNYISFHGAPNGCILFDTTLEQLVLGLGSGIGRQLCIVETDYRISDFDHATPTDPALFIHSAENPGTDNTQYIGFSHDKSDANITVGKGVLKIDTDVELAFGKVYKANARQVVGARQAHIADPSGGTPVDTEARAAICSVLSALETHGLLASS